MVSGGPSSSAPELNTLFAQYGATYVSKPFEVLNTPTFDRIYRLYFSMADSVDQFVAGLETLAFIDFAERVPVKYSFETFPNDPSVPDISYHLELIRAYEAFDLHQGGGAVVAIVDDAVLVTHEDLADNVVLGRDVADLDDDPNPPFSILGAVSVGRFSHGTHVAGIAGAVTDNNIGIASIGWNNQLMAIKTVKDDADPSNIPFAYDGVAWATANGAQVINMSWGSIVFSQSEYMVIEEAWQSGIILVAASGNVNSAEPFYPAAFGSGFTGELWESVDPNMVVAVASISADGNLSSFGNNAYGAPIGSNFGPWVDVCSYGEDIFSCFASSTDNGQPVNNLYGLNTGTSMAAPQVAGLAGLMLSYKPGATADEIINCLINSANPDINDPILFPGNYPSALGRGRIDVFAALQCLAVDCESAIAVISPSSNTICPNANVVLTANSGTAYLWSTGETTQSIIVGQSGTYEVTITFHGQCTASAAITVEEAITEPTIIISENLGNYANDGIMCGPNSNGTVTINAYWGQEYLWGNFGGLTRPTLNIFFAGTNDELPYTNTYSVTVTGVGGCAGVTGTTSVELTWQPNPAADISVAENSNIPNDGTICVGESATLTVSGGAFYEWNTGETAASIVISPFNSTSYAVTVTDVNGCSSEAEVLVNVVDCSTLNFTCPCTDANSRNIDAGNGTLLSSLYGAGQGQLPTGGVFNTCLAINGRLIIDEDYTIEGGEIRMQPGASIRVEMPAELTIRNINNSNVIHGCGQMWRGIEVGPEAKLNFEGNWIEDAQYAIIIHDQSQLFIQNNTFNRNFVGIFTEPGFGNNVQLPLFPEGPIVNNYFFCTSGLLPGYSGQWPVVEGGDISFTGIEVNDAVINIGDFNNANAVNHFDGLRNAIWARRSIVNVYNCLIENMDYGLPLVFTGYDAEGNGIFLQECQAEVLGNTLENVSLGINALSSGLVARDNTLIDNVDGISTSFSSDRNVELVSNDIEFSRFGASAWLALQLDARNNTLTHISGLPTDYGEAAIAVGSALPPSFGIGDKLIRENTINLSANGCVGISIGGHGYVAAGNIININDQAQDGVLSGSLGLILGGSSSNYLYSNIVNANTLANNGGMGLFAGGAAGNTLCCNSFDNTHYGLFFWGMCDDTQLRHSAIGAHRTGLRCQYGTVIGDQTHGGNQWLGSYGQYSAAHLGNFDEVSNSEFFVQLPVIPPLWPDSPYSPNNPNWFRPTDGAAQDCLEDSVCPMPPTLGEGAPPIDENDLHAARGLYGNPTFGAYLNWEGARHLYRKLEQYPALLGQDTAVDSFYLASSQNNIGAFHEIESGILALYQPEIPLKTRLAAVDFYQSEIKALREALVQATDTLEQALINAGIEYNGQLLAQQWAAFDGLYAAKDKERALAAEELAQQNASISAITLLEQNEQAVAQVFLQTIAQGIYQLDSLQLSQMEAIAWQCPFEGGHSVYRARMLLSLSEKNFFDDEALCQVEALRRPPRASIAEPVFSRFILFPNPAKDSWSLSVPESLWGEPLTIRSYALTGQLAASWEYPAVEALIEIEEGRLVPGLYFIEAWSGANRLSVQRLIIVD